MLTSPPSEVAEQASGLLSNGVSETTMSLSALKEASSTEITQESALIASMDTPMTDIVAITTSSSLVPAPNSDATDVRMSEPEPEEMEEVKQADKDVAMESEAEVLVNTIESTQAEAEPPVTTTASTESEARPTTTVEHVEMEKPQLESQLSAGIPTPQASETQEREQESEILEETKMADLVNIETEPDAITNGTQDSTLNMNDAVTSLDSLPKISREREEDPSDEPFAKRQRTGEPETLDKSATAPSSHQSVPEALRGRPITPLDAKEISKNLKNTARSKDGKGFAIPVIESWPHFKDSYMALVSTPMDLRTIGDKLQALQYDTYDALIADLDLMVNNASTFNGPAHTVVAAGQRTRDGLVSKLASLATREPATMTKRRASTPLSEKKAPRKPSRAAPPPVVAPPQTYALNPTTHTPFIRRESTTIDGSRPKREIHPPKNKDLPYANVRPRNKKFAIELKFCDKVMSELRKPKYTACTIFFMEPVDPVALNIPNYGKVIKKPMDLGTISQKLETGEYDRAKEFEADIRLIVANCVKFNGEDHAVSVAARELERQFDLEWEKKDSFIANHTPVAASPTGGHDDDSDEEQSEEEPAEDSPAAARLAVIDAKVIEEQQKLINMMTSGASGGEVALQKSILDAVLQHRAASDVPPAAKTKTKRKPSQVGKPLKKTATARKGSGSIPSNRKPAKPKARGPMTMVEKEVISHGLGHLPEDVAEHALDIIKSDRPEVGVSSKTMQMMKFCANICRLVMMAPSSWTLT